MTENQLERRYKILENLTGDKRDNYTIILYDSFVDIRNKTTLEGIHTDSLQVAKKWIIRNMELKKLKKYRYTAGNWEYRAMGKEYITETGIVKAYTKKEAKIKAYEVSRHMTIRTLEEVKEKDERQSE